MAHTAQKKSLSIVPTLGQYKGKWVALSQDEKTMWCFGKTIDEVMEKVHKQGKSYPLLVKIPDAATANLFF